MGKRRDIAFWAAIVGALALVLALVAARGASAQTPLAGGAGPGGPAAAFLVHPAEEEAEEDDGSVGDECESDDEEAEERCEERLEREEEEKEEAEEAEELRECRIEGAEATVVAVPGRGEVKLAVHYLTYRPSAVAIEVALRGSMGPLDLGVEGAHFGRQGTLRAGKKVSSAEMARVQAAKEFTVEIHARNAPGFCDGLERHLTSRHGLRWSDPTAAQRAKEAARESHS